MKEAHIAINFEGYIMCRLAVDPDPSDEQRGVSGYTLALAREDNLDNWIQLNPSSGYLDRNLREPGKSMVKAKALNLGVKVTGVQLDGRDFAEGQSLLGGHVNLLDDPQAGHPIFEGRNDIIGSDDEIQFPIDPFIIDIQSPAPAIHINRQDLLPGNRRIWELQTSEYRDRLGQPPNPLTTTQPNDAMKAIGVYDADEYFRNRARWIREQIEKATDQTELQEFKTRLYVVEFFGQRLRDHLQLLRIWTFNVDGGSTGIAEGLSGIDLTAPWPITFWIGGFDGDLMLGYLRGTLCLPLVHAPA
ncbi:MAG TPA: hypothetical protein VNL35_22000 [Chloroflexota bacterium]|nr:hypothetical protein [Chloroflexota bacterium]